ncbi:MAG: FHA domain-containing protein [Cyanobacteria bacterium J06649_4]
MINCPNCNHQNPDAALQCEACYTPLPGLASCPNCGATIQADASFCGQCGSDLRTTGTVTSSAAASSGAEFTAGMSSDPASAMKTQNFLVPEPAAEQTSTASATPDLAEIPDLVEPDPLVVPAPIGESSSAAANAAPPTATPAIPTPAPAVRAPATQIQVLSARLKHVQTDASIEISRELSVVRIGKPNDHTPPDIDVSGFPDSEIVSRVHANIRVEGDTYFLEDVGSSNGTYINGLPLPTGNRHRLRSGDRIALGKGDKVSFIFESGS